MLSKKKILLFTFDYELFLGKRSGTVQECLIKPTNRLLSLLQSAGFKAIFFIDTVYLMRLKEITDSNIKASNDLTAINEQLRTIVQHGHYIFPHLHPHWLDAVYLPELNEWSLVNKRYYQFSSLSSLQQENLFDDGVQLISSIAKTVVKDYEVNAYRAGGWSIQPFESFKSYFIKHAIRHELSVIPGKYLQSDAHTFDFRKAPVNTPIYRFTDDVCVEEKDGMFTEWSISTISMTRFEKWIDFKISGLTQRIMKKEIQKGSTVSSNIIKKGDVYSKKNVIRIIASFEGLNFFRIKKLDTAIKRSNYFQFISHPKLITRREFNMTQKLFFSLKKKYQIETDFRKVI